MFICNVSLKNNILKKIGLILLVLLIIIVFIVVGFKFYKSISTVKVKDSIDNSTLEVNCNNYTSILKDSYENVDKYVGKKIKFSGFVYRLFDFKDNQFVLAREMIIDNNNHAVVVGFLSECDDIRNFKTGSWVEVEGVIEKGNYHGNIPIIKIKSIKETTVPSDEYVYPPDDNYVSSEI
jgi:uncharacterized repeat protein (TIGR03943 family)